MAPDEAQAVGAAFAGIAAARAPFNDLENVVIDHDGRAHATLTSGTPILDAGGELLGYRGIDRDISVRRAAEDRIKRLTNLYNALSECNQAIVRCNSAADSVPPDLQRRGALRRHEDGVDRHAERGDRAGRAGREFRGDRGLSRWRGRHLERRRSERPRSGRHSNT
jgi:hypothetical protein